MTIRPFQRIRTLALVTAAVLAGAAQALAADLRVSLASDPAMIDPITYSELIANQVISNMYEPLAAVGANGSVVPALAERWEPLDGNKGVRFHLRKGVKFHSGREMKAADVKFSFEQLLIPQNRGGLNSTYLNIVQGADKVKDGSTTELSGVTIVDDYTVEIHFTQPDVLFPVYPIYIMDSGIVAEAGPDWFNKVSAGTGPFAFAEWRRGQDITLTAHKNYWGGAPALDGVKFLVVPSSDTALSMFETGDLDLMTVGDDLIRRVRGDAALKERTLTAPRAQVRYLAMNSKLYEPFKDAKVREAICLSIDQQAMIDGLYSGAAVPLYGQTVEGVGGYNPDIAKFAYDPEKAKAALAASAYAGGLPPFKLSALESSKNQHLYLASQFADILNWTVEVEIVERGTFLKSINSQQTGFFAFGWTADYLDAMNFLEQLWTSGSPYNRGWSNPAFDALIAKAKVTADDQARYAIYHEAEKLLMADWGTCPLPVSIQMMLVGKGVKGVALAPTGVLPFGAVSKAD